MTSVSSPEFTSAMDRMDSGDTNDSPFGSNLVTPTDEEAHNNQGIHERFDVAKTILGYFGNKSLSGEGNSLYDEPCSDVIKLQPMGETVKDTSISMEVEESHSLKDVFISEEEETPHPVQDTDVADDSGFIPLNDTFDTMPCIPSVLSSLSSTDSIQRPRKGSIYNLPNTHIEVETLSEGILQEIEAEQYEADIDEHEPLPLLNTDVGIESDSWALLVGALSESFVDLVFFCLRVSLFLPWCIAVGGALILSPEILEPLAFGTGYIEPLSGIRRYSHWATYGFQHVVSFFTLIGALAWMVPSIGYLTIGGLLAQFCFTWHGFLFDSTIPLGEDDLQTVYLLATTTWFNHDHTINIKKVDESYYSTRNLTTDSELAEDSD